MWQSDCVTRKVAAKGLHCSNCLSNVETQAPLTVECKRRANITVINPSNAQKPNKNSASKITGKKGEKKKRLMLQ